MSVTLEKKMTVLSARQVLDNTRAAPEDRVAEAERVVRAFNAEKPRRQCYACPSGIWSMYENAAGDDVVWGCAGCRTPASRTIDEVRERQAEKQAAQQATARAAEVAAASEPKPRVILKQRLAALAEAQAGAEKLERAVPTARSRVWECQALVEAAEAAAAEANQDAASSLADSLATGKPIGPSSAGARARANLAEAIDSAVVAKNGRVILESRLTDAKTAVGYAADAARKAARTVISSERIEDLINDALEARAAYVDAVGALGWLVRNHAITVTAKTAVRTRSWAMRTFRHRLGKRRSLALVPNLWKPHLMR
jgi:hypothetical protein